MVLVGTILHRTTAFPMESSQRDELRDKITDIEVEIKGIYEKINQLSGPSNVLDNKVGTYPDANQMCLSKECIAASHKLFQNADFSVNPCDDFYQFSCGNYNKTTTIPEDKGMMSASFSPLRDISKVPF